MNEVKPFCLSFKLVSSLSAFRRRRRWTITVYWRPPLETNNDATRSTQAEIELGSDVKCGQMFLLMGRWPHNLFVIDLAAPRLLEREWYFISRSCGC